jgi:hypothetical protein
MQKMDEVENNNFTYYKAHRQKPSDLDLYLYAVLPHHSEAICCYFTQNLVQEKKTVMTNQCCTC